MTPARKAALQWFHDNPGVTMIPIEGPSQVMRKKMIADGELETTSNGQLQLMSFHLTDKGRRALHGDETSKEGDT